MTSKKIVKAKTDSTSLTTEDQKQKVKEMLGSLIGENIGGNSKEFGFLIFNQLSNACYTDTDFSNTLHNMIAELEGIAPKDQVEGMLAAQMIATHHATMDCFKMIAGSNFYDVKNAMINSANKLSRTYATQMEALIRYRGKGQQKMTVEHVHINSGGQAIIGNVTKNITSMEEGGNSRGVT